MRYALFAALVIAFVFSSPTVSAAQSSAPGQSWAAAPFERAGESVSHSSASQVNPTIYYIGRWEAFDIDGEQTWRPEHSVDAWMDLRTYTQTALEPSPAGTVQCCLFAVSSTPVVGTGWTQLATSVRGALPVNLRTLETVLGFPDRSLSAASLSELAWQLFVTEASLSRDRAPLSPNRNGVWTVELDGVRLFNESREDNPETWQLVIDRVRADYIKIRDESRARGDFDLYRKYLKTQADRYRVDYRVFLSGLPDEGVLKPTTTIGDTFVDSDGVNLSAHTATGPNSGFSWSELAGDWEINANNEAEIQTTANTFARADSDLSTDDHWCEVSFPDLTSGDIQAGPAVRKDSSATLTYYHTRLDRTPSGTIDLFKVSSGSFSLLATTTVTESNSLLRLEVGGDGSSSDLEVFFNSISIITHTDSSSPISGNLRGGIRGRVVGGDVDDFQCEDSAAAPAGRRVLIVQ